MRSFALCSGSSGNAFYVESSSGQSFLVDVGLSFAKAEEILAQRGIEIKNLTGIFITHEHSDHVSGLNSFLKKVKCPLYMSEGSRSALKLENSKLQIVKHHSSLSFDDMKVFVVSKPHDALEALSFIFDDGSRLGVFTDLGHVTDEIKHLMKTLDLMYLEANYCEDYVRGISHTFNSTYLNRLMSHKGHLGVHQSIEALLETAHDKQTVMLSHVSENTNSYENVFLKVKEALFSAGKFPHVMMSFQGEPSEWLE